MVKLIALDLDRTTLTSDGHLSEANKRALSGAIKRGVHVCIASGRAFDTLPEEVLNVQGIEYAITSNGASVYRIADRKCIKSYILKPQSVDNVLSVCKQYPVTYEAFIRGCAYAAKEYIDNPVKYGATENAIQYVRSTRILKENIIKYQTIADILFSPTDKRQMRIARWLDSVRRYPATESQSFFL